MEAGERSIKQGRSPAKQCPCPSSITILMTRQPTMCVPALVRPDMCKQPSLRPARPHSQLLQRLLANHSLVQQHVVEHRAQRVLGTGVAGSHLHRLTAGRPIREGGCVGDAVSQFPGRTCRDTRTEGGHRSSCPVCCSPGQLADPSQQPTGDEGGTAHAPDGNAQRSAGVGVLGQDVAARLHQQEGRPHELNHQAKQREGTVIASRHVAQQ